MKVVDLVIKNCKIVVPKMGIFSAGIAVENGKVVAIASESHLPKADSVIDVKSNYVLPGVIDPHVHYGTINPLAQDAKTETQSAAIGGVTTVMRHYRDAKSYFEGFDYEKQTLKKNTLIDFAFQFIIMTDQHLKEMRNYVGKLGVTSFKFFMSHKKGYLDAYARAHGVIGIDDGFLYLALKKMASFGPPLIACLHAENQEIINRLEGKMRKTKQTNMAVWNDTRPNFTEEESISRAIILGKLTGCPIYIVHMTSVEGARLVAKAKSAGLNVLAETCPIYLTFSRGDYKQLGVIGKASPPLRDTESIERLWRGVADGTIDTIGSDHGAKSREIKIGKGDMWSATPGFPGSATMLPLLLSEGVNKRKIPLEKIVEVSSYNPARIFGIYPKKGTIAIGSDADFTIIDLKKKVIVKPEILKSSADWTIYDGWKFKGWPIMTIIRGNVIVEDGEIVGKNGTGKYINRKLDGAQTSRKN